MPLIIRIDVDRPYGRRPIARHLLSRLSSDLYFPRIEQLGYLKELQTIIRTLNDIGAKSHIFFRGCTLPSKRILSLIGEGNHEIGLHLENSRSFETFSREKMILERHIGAQVTTFSKHGSGGSKYGFHHHAPYEPELYLDWAKRSGFKLFLGNLEDPSIRPSIDSNGLNVFPSAFWLETAWRDTKLYPVDWLIKEAERNDIVLLIHPENVLADSVLTKDFLRIINSIQSMVIG